MTSVRAAALALAVLLFVLAWLLGESDDAPINRLLVGFSLGLIILAAVPWLTISCSYEDVLFLSSDGDWCIGMVIGYGLIIYSTAGLARKMVR
jgi:hypothetical protein